MTRAAQTIEARPVALNEWFRARLKDSRRGLSFGDLDFVFEEYRQRRLLTLEIKAGGHVTWPYGIRTTHGILDAALRAGCPAIKYAYQGFFLLHIPGGVPADDDEVWLNLRKVRTRALMDHLNFAVTAVPPLTFDLTTKRWQDIDGRSIRDLLARNDLDHLQVHEPEEYQAYVNASPFHFERDDKGEFSVLRPHPQYPLPDPGRR